MRKHPLQASRLSELGADYLVRRRLNEALWPYGAAADSDPLARALALRQAGAPLAPAMALLADALPAALRGHALLKLLDPSAGPVDALAAATDQALDAALGGLPWTARADPDALLSPALRLARDALALWRHEPLAVACVPLAASWQPRGPAPRCGGDAAWVAVSGDPQDPLAVRWLEQLRAALRERPAAGLIWCAAPLPHHLGGRRACERIAMLGSGADPREVWSAIERLCRHRRLVAVGELDRLLGPVPVAADLRAGARAVDAELGALAASGVPRTTPWAILGERLFVGRASLGALLAALDDELAGGPARRGARATPEAS